MKKKEIYNYLMNVKKSIGYIPSRTIINAYNTHITKDYTNVRVCTNDVYTALKNKTVWKFN